MKKQVNKLCNLLCPLVLLFFFIGEIKAQEDLDQIERLNQLLEVSKSDTSRIRILLTLYDIYLDLDMLKSKKYAEEALELAEKIDNPLKVAESAEKIGDVYQMQGVYQNASEYYLKSLSLREKIKDDNKAIANTYNQLGNITVEQGDNEKALEYYLKSLNIRENIQDKQGILVSLSNLGGFYYRQGKFEQALDYHQQALSIADSLGNKQVLSYNLNRIAETYYRMDKLEESLNYFQQQLYIAQSIGERLGIQKAYKGLSQIYAKLGDYKRAYEYYQYYASAKELAFKEKSTQKIEQIQAAKKQTETELLLDKKIKEDETERQNLIYIVGILSASIVLVIATGVILILYRNNRQNKRINRLLEQQKQAIQKTNEKLKEQNDKIQSQSIAIKEKSETLEITFEEIERKNKDITGSINYAKRIQESMLPFEKTMTASLPEHFVIFKPRDIVSGDFYWFEEIHDKIILAAVDCTGHGIPGAFMSMVGDSYLNQIVIMQGITSPELILTELHRNIRKALKQDETENRDGMDVALCVIDKEAKTMEFSGAARPIIFIRNQEMEDIMTSKLPIGGFQKETERVFTKQTFKLEEPCIFYIFSDGYQDQFGGPKGRKFAKNKLTDLLFEIHEKPMQEQKSILEGTLKNWMQASRQMDDILVIGVKITL